MKQYYLYGASVQGIQSYIFRTNELRNIVEEVPRLSVFAQLMMMDYSDALRRMADSL